MKRLFALLIASVVTVGLGAQYRNPLEDLDDSETVRALKEHVATLSAAQMEGRKAGSEGEKMAAEYMESCLREMGIDILTAGHEFKVAGSPDTLSSRNVVGFLEGWDKAQKDHYIVIGARMDNLGMDTYMLDGEKVNRIYYGANGNASGMAVLLELARKLSYSRALLRRSVLFVGFGASAQTFAGSWYFLNRAFASDAGNIDAMVNLDMLGTAKANGLLAFTASNGDLNALVSTLQGELLPIQAQLTTQAPYPGDQVVFEGGADSSDPCQAGAGPSCPVGDVAVGFRFVGAPQVADGGGVGRGHDPVGQVHAAYADGGEEVGELCRFPWFHRAPFRVTSAIHRQICDKIHNYYYYEIEKKVVAWCYRNPR